MDIERIETRGEDGRRVLVVMHRNRIDTSDLDGPSSIEGLAQYQLVDGKLVSVDGDEFEVVATGEVLVRA